MNDRHGVSAVVLNVRHPTICSWLSCIPLNTCRHHLGELASMHMTTGICSRYAQQQGRLVFPIALHAGFSRLCT